MAAAPDTKARSKDQVGLVRFGQGIAELNMKARDGYDYRAPPADVQELELPPTCTLPSLAWDPSTGRMSYPSLLHPSNGAVANVKFDECTGVMLAVSHNWLILSYFLHHHQQPMSAAVPARALQRLQTFTKVLANPQSDLVFPATAVQPKRLVAFDPLRVRAKKGSVSNDSECTSLHHHGLRQGTAVPRVKPSAASAGKKPSMKKTIKRAAALKAPVSTRVSRTLYDMRNFCNACSKINAMRLNTTIRMWTIPDVARRFGSDHPFAKSWAAIAKNMTATVIAGLAVSNVTSAAVRRVHMLRAGSLARSPAVYLLLTFLRTFRGGNLKILVSTIYADRMHVAAGVLACASSVQSVENLSGDLSKLLRDPKTARTLAETGKFKFPKLLPANITSDASTNGIAQQWWWSALSSRSGPKPTQASRFIAVPNRHDKEGSYTFVCSEMWNVLAAVRDGWKLCIKLAPPFEPKDMRPAVGSSGVMPVHAAYESACTKAPFPEVMCGEYATWFSLLREMENRKVAANSADPKSWAPLDLTGNWMRAEAGVVIRIPGWSPPLEIKLGHCFNTLCRLATIFKFSNFKIDLSPYSDYAAYPPARQEQVQECVKKHQEIIMLIRAKTGTGTVRASDPDGSASAERILQDVCTRI